jgi:hypothetical protein
MAVTDKTLADAVDRSAARPLPRRRAFLLALLILGVATAVLWDDVRLPAKKRPGRGAQTAPTGAGH